MSTSSTVAGRILTTSRKAVFGEGTYPSERNDFDEGGIDGRTTEPVMSEGPNLGRERELSGSPAKIERLDAEGPANQRQFVGAPIEDGEGEHPIEALGELDGAEVFVAVDEHFGVGRAAEGVSLRDQVRAQLEKVVDFAVVDDLDLSVLVCHRLAAQRAEVDDRQPAHADADAGFDERCRSRPVHGGACSRPSPRFPLP